MPEGGTEQTIFYDAGEDNTVAKFNVNGRTVTAHSKTDSFGRKVFDEIQLGTGFVSRQFYYHTGNVSPLHTVYEKVKSAPTTHLVSQITLSDDTTLLYAYDNEERITQVTEITARDGNLQTNTTHYSYDALGQLTEEIVNNIPVNTVTYDNYGNIQTKNGKQYSYHATWRDLLICYDGQEITYDHQGNPLSYLGHTLTWEKGRQLKSYDGYTYTYNANGIRTSKTANGATHNYVLDGTKILRETWNGNVLTPLYDNEDSVLGILYNNTPYYFQKNLQGDVIAILDQNAQVVVRYSYDAWGKPSVRQDDSGIFLALANPYLYRSYYYDWEIGKYYLQSRYYDPVVGRFLNSDDPVFLGVAGTVLNYNLFAYCENNIVNDCDSTGMLSVAAIVRFVKTIGSKAWKIITSIWKAFVQPGKINLKPFEIVIDVLVGVFVPSLSSALKLLTYKAFNKKLVQIAFKNAGKSFINLLTKLGLNIGLNTLFAAAVNNLIFKHMSRFLTVGGIICLVVDVIDGSIDYWFNYARFA